MYQYSSCEFEVLSRVYPSVGSSITIHDVLASDVPQLGAFGCIRSREDQDLRSDSTMHLLPQTGIGAPGFGIISAFVWKYWGNDVPGIGDSELLLEGGDGHF